jgi:hypothetical protein
MKNSSIKKVANDAHEAGCAREAGPGDAARCYHTPVSLAKLWGVCPETIITMIRSGRLLAFTCSPAKCKRPRWRISPEAIRLYELANQGPGAAKSPRRSAKNAEVIAFF